MLPGFDLTATVQAQRQGHDISAALAAVQLDLAGLSRLTELTALAAPAGPTPPPPAAVHTLEEDEWADAVAILVQVLKVRVFPNWRQQERDANLLLDPAVFQSGAPVTITLPVWRASWPARAGWLQRLTSRADQLTDQAAALAAAVATAEQVALPPLRDAALAAASTTAGALSAQLGIDLQAGPQLTTTRLDQAVAALQNLLNSVDRAGLVAVSPPWQVFPPSAVAAVAGELPWMTSFAAWASAMNVFYYPESHLLPATRPTPPPDTLPGGTQMTRQFADLVNGLADPLTDPYLHNGPQDDYRTAQTAAFVYWTNVSRDAHSGQPPDFFVRPSPALGGFEGYPPSELFTAGQLSDFKAAQHTWFNPMGAPARYRSFADIEASVREILLELPLQLALGLAQARQWPAALSWLRLVYDHEQPAGSREVFAGFGLDQRTVARPVPDWLNGGYPDPHRFAGSASYLRFTLLTLAGVLCDWADDEFARDSAETRARARLLYLQACEVLAEPALTAADATAIGVNPELTALLGRATNNLRKLRGGLNIAGISRPLTGITGAGITGAGGPAAFPPPTGYRFATLVARAQQLVGSAAQIEDRYLASLEKRDAETYNQLLAGQDLAVASQRVPIAQEQAAIAKQQVTVVQQGVVRAQTQSTTYMQWINAGPNQYEQDMLADYQKEKTFQGYAAKAQAAAAVLSGIGSAVSGLATSVETGNPLAFIGGVASLAGGIAGAHAAEYSGQAQQAAVDAQIASAQASFERRTDQWKLDKQVADIDAQTATLQVGVASAQAQVAADEAGVAGLVRDNAQAKLTFLVSKLTNA